MRRPRHRILFALILALVAICLSPFLVGPSVRVWIWWKAWRENLVVKIDQIDAPFLHPIILRGVQVTSSPAAAYRVNLNATQASVGLNFNAILLRGRGRALRNISVTGLRAEIHHNENGKPFPEQTWATWQKLLPDNFAIEQIDLRIEDGATVILLRGGALTASELEAGRCNADEFTIASPLVRRTFSHLRGATRWQDNYLTLAGLSLIRGLDVEWITVDLSHLAQQHIGLEFDVDAFGGKIRGDVSNEWREGHSNWNIASSAADVSLGQTAEAIGFADRVAGRLHAGKVTFRGDMHDPMHATASLWTELTAPAWRNREADVLMLGAAFYNRQVDLQQLYIKQGKNQLTLSGEGPLPEKLSDWLTPDFRANISAAISNLGDFASLFGGKREDFAGEISIEGTLNSRGHKLGGQFSANGRSLLFFKSIVDLFSVKLNFAPNEFEITELNLQRNDDFLRAQGKIDIAPPHNCRGTIQIGAQNIADYVLTSLPPTYFAVALVFDGRAATLDSLTLGRLGFTGTLDFSDLEDAGITLNPKNALFDLSRLDPTDCANGLEFLAAGNAGELLPRIEEIDLNANLLKGTWSLLLKKDTGAEQRAICSGAGGGTLQIGVRNENTNALQTFRTGERKALSFSLDRP